MRVLVACERSGVVRRAFRKLGHAAWSCDILPATDGGEHIHWDVRDALDDQWDLMIAHPPCTDLSVSGARYWAAKQADGRQSTAANFFMALINAPIDRIAVENPVGVMSSLYRKPDQIIQPYQFGHAESKRTCLWLKNLPLLKPTHILPLPERGYWDNQTPSGQNKLGPSAERAALRAVTYEGWAEAMAEQWGGLEVIT